MYIVYTRQQLLQTWHLQIWLHSISSIRLVLYLYVHACNKLNIIIQQQTKLSRISIRMIRSKTKRAIRLQMINLRKHVTSCWKQVVSCLINISVHNNHLKLEHCSSPPPSASSRPSVQAARPSCSYDNDDASDLVSIKICILGDPKIGKTSFLVSSVLSYLPTHIFTFSNIRRCLIDFPFVFEGKICRNRRRRKERIKPHG